MNSTCPEMRYSEMNSANKQSAVKTFDVVIPKTNPFGNGMPQIPMFIPAIYQQQNAGEFDEPYPFIEEIFSGEQDE